MSLEMKYFVLKPKAKDVYDMYARASQDAMFAYSDRIRTTDPALANQLWIWAMQEKRLQDELCNGWKYLSKKVNPESE